MPKSIQIRYSEEEGQNWYQMRCCTVVRALGKPAGSALHPTVVETVFGAGSHPSWLVSPFDVSRQLALGKGE